MAGSWSSALTRGTSSARAEALNRRTAACGRLTSRPPGHPRTEAGAQPGRGRERLADLRKDS